MLKIFILVSGKTFFFLPSFAFLNTANFSSKRILSVVLRPRISRSHAFMILFAGLYSLLSVIRFPFFKGACNLLPSPEMEGNARLLE